MLIAVLLLSGCSFFSRSQSKYYSIDQVQGSVLQLQGVPVAIDGIELPPGADRKEVAVRKGDQQLEIRSADQWTASLQPLVLHTLAFDLANRLPPGMVILPGEAKPTGVTRSIDVIFGTFAAGPELSVVLDATVVIHASSQPETSYRELITIDIPSLDSAAIASGYSRALGTLADRISAAVAGQRPADLRQTRSL